MAGSNSAFNAAEFRNAIQQAMQMGQPNDASQQVTFVWLERDSYTPEGPDNDPYSWTQAPTAVTSPGRTFVQLNAAVQMDSHAPVESDAMGGFDAGGATLTLLDTDYANVEGADQVLIGGVTYVIDPPGAIPSGLFDVTIYQMHVSQRS